MHDELIQIMQPCLIQISPLAASNQDVKSHALNNISRITAPMAKLFLQKQKWIMTWDSIHQKEENDAGALSKWNVRRGTLSSTVTSPSKTTSVSSKKESIAFPVVNLPSQDPTESDGVPCLIRAYCIVCSQGGEGMDYLGRNQFNTMNVMEVVDGTLVQIFVPIKVLDYMTGDKVCHIPKVMEENLTFNLPSRCYESSFPSSLMGDIPLDPILDGNEAQRIFQCHDMETVEALTLRMKMLLSNVISIGTTSDALQNRKWNNMKRNRMQVRLDRYWDRHKSVVGSSGALVTNDEPPPTKNEVPKEAALKALFSHGALTVHCPHNASGKTSLVSTIARSTLKCQTHVLNGSTLFAKYGASGADAALESLLHGILIAAATASIPVDTECISYKEGKGSIPRVCVILDHLETFVPLPGSVGRGDPSIATLNAMGKNINAAFSLWNMASF